MCFLCEIFRGHSLIFLRFVVIVSLVGFKGNRFHYWKCLFVRGTEANEGEASEKIK